MEWTEVRHQFQPLMHVVCLVYSHSDYYNTAARIIILLDETCNLFIDMARKFLDPTSIFQIEVTTIAWCQ
jgi:dynein heavy chain